LISKNRIFLLKISWLIEEDGLLFDIEPITLLRKEIVVCSIPALRKKKARFLIFQGLWLHSERP